MAISRYNALRLWRKTSRQTKTAMNAELSTFAARLGHVASWVQGDHGFNELALALFALQFKYNPAYRKICEAHHLTPDVIEHWAQIPFVPTAAFKELELSSIPPEERTAVFHSSGTTEQKPSRHFHCAESLKAYEASLWPWFHTNVISSKDFELVVLTPPPSSVPYSSLVHMFKTVAEKMPHASRTSLSPQRGEGLRVRGEDNTSMSVSGSVFVGKTDPSGAWLLDFDKTVAALRNTRTPKLLLGTAFSFVHLLDDLAAKDMRIQLPPGSRAMETGGYKNRSRSMPKDELHSLISERLGVPRENIICEYGMSELSSQAYDTNSPNKFRFPPWARVQIISPETGREVADGETGLIRIFDLANVYSVAAIQTEDLGIRRGSGFELIGRAALAEPRGCSLQTA